MIMPSVFIYVIMLIWHSISNLHDQNKCHNDKKAVILFSSFYDPIIPNKFVALPIVIKNNKGYVHPRFC